MARRKVSSNEFREEPDEVSVEGEVIGMTDDPAPTTEAPVDTTIQPEEAPTVEPTLHSSDDPRVTIKEPPKPKDPALSAATIAEQEAGRALLEANKSKPAGNDEDELA